jgi:hypothetical protein
MFATSIGFMPATTAISWYKHLFGQNVEDHSPGCAVATVILLIAGFPLSWAVWHYFHVVWR